MNERRKSSALISKVASASPLAAELHPFPDGWYALGLADDLTASTLWSRTFAGQEVVAFRDPNGAPAVVGAYCPHLGAHMGHGGCVKEGTVECPFHAFRFDRDGQCVATGYGTKPPPKAVVDTWTVLERNGLILVWHANDGAPPEWEPPALDWEGWSPLKHHALDLISHPQETTENSVDTGHLTVVHGYSNVAILDPLEVNGPHLTSRYTMTRHNPWVPALPPVVSAFRVHVWGLGYSFVDIHIETFDVHFRLFILSTPRDGERVDLRVALSVREDFNANNIVPGLGLVPRSWLAKLLRSQTLKGVVNDVQQDFDMWQNKIYVDRPALAQGDGPVGPYRRYCRQFYPSADPE